MTKCFYCETTEVVVLGPGEGLEKLGKDGELATLDAFGNPVCKSCVANYGKIKKFLMANKINFGG